MNLLIKGGTLLTMTGTDYTPGDLLIKDKKIAAIDSKIPVDSSVKIINAAGCIVIPGIIESHCHIGITEERKGKEGDDANESSNPITPDLRAVDAVNPMDAAFSKAIEAGITSVMVGPGSSNVVGGQFLFMKTGGSRCIDDLIVKQPAAMKAALGENPKTCYSSSGKAPMTRMAIAAMLREQLFKASVYKNKKEQAEKKHEDFDIDFKMECWLPVLNREIPLKTHAHRTDDILTAIRIAKEFNIELTLDHCSEGHLITEFIKKSGFPAIVGPDLASRSKIEVENMAFKTAGILDKAGILVSLTTDHPVSLIQSLPTCAGLAAKNGLGKEAALRAITSNAAKICRVDHRVGSLKVGLDADLAIFDEYPLNLFSHCLYTIIDGEIVFEFDRK